METRAGRRALRPRSCLCLEGETPTARRARWTSLFGVDLWRADETKKARSVVALSCVPRGERGSPVSPPAAGRCSGRGSLRQNRGPCLRDIHPPRANPCPWRLSGLLSGCPPTSTRPQARANVGQGLDTCDSPRSQGLFGDFLNGFAANAEPSALVTRSPAAAAWQWTAQAASLNCRAVACHRPSFRVPIDAAS